MTDFNELVIDCRATEEKNNRWQFGVFVLAKKGGLKKWIG